MGDCSKPWKCSRCEGFGKIKLWTHMYPEPPCFEWIQCPRCLGGRGSLKLVKKEKEQT